MAEVRKRFVATALKSWTDLNEAISDMTLEEVIFALELENDMPAPRKTFLKRLTQRYNGIRAEEVKEELNDLRRD